MFRLSKRSINNLEMVHPALVKIVKRAIEITTVDFVVIQGVRTLQQQKEFMAKDRKIALIGLATIHTQLLIGLVIYFISPKGFSSLGQMSDKALRLTSLEHPLINLIGIN